MQDGGGLLHFHHEGGLAARDVVRGADTRKDAINDREFRAFGRHKRAGLRHHGEQGGLPQERGLAAHVGAGEDDELFGGRVERHVVGHKRRGHVAFHHRVPGIKRRKLVALMNVRLGVVARCGRVGQRGECIE